MRVKSYEKYSLDDIKSTIKSEINNASSSFVAIGFYLKNVRDRELFKADGYKDIWGFATKEFGISKSSASRFMAINDRFSKNGNSPFLLVVYENFSSSKLQEMLTLTDEQLGKINYKTTVKEIREMKPKKKIKKETQTEVKPYASCDAYNLKNSCIGCYYDKNDCCAFDRTVIKTVATSQQEKVSNPILTKNGSNVVFKCPACGKIVDFGVDCECGRKLSWDRYEAYKQKEEHLIDELDLPVGAYNNLCKIGINTIEQLCSYTYDELNTTRMGKYCMTRIEEALMDAGLHLKSDVEESSQCEEDCGARCGNSIEEVILGADIVVDAEYKEVPELIYNGEDIFNDFLKANGTSINEIVSDTLYSIDTSDKNQFRSTQIRNILTNKFSMYTKSFSDFLRLADDNKDVEIIEQAELPLLKNNDQRKEFIESYKTWPIWIDQELTGERYYRYCLSEKVAIVIKVNKKHGWENYKETKEIEYGAEQYYLLGVKIECGQSKTKFVEDNSKTFYECNTNKSALVDYLREMQKNEKKRN